MNTHQTSRPGQPCDAFEALLAQSLLEPEAAEELRTHAAGCARCRARLVVYDRLDNALRRHVAQFARSPLQTEDIVQSLETPDGSLPAAPQELTYLSALPSPAAAPAPPRRSGGRPRRVFSWMAAIAAVLVVALVTTALVASRHPAGPAAPNKKPATTQVPALPASVYGTEGTLGSDNNGVIFALNAADGTLRWQFPTPQAMSFKLLVNQGVLYFGETDGSVYALDARTGKYLWHIKLPGSPAPDQIANGIVYVSTLEPNGYDQPGIVSLYALDTRTGAQLWHFDNGGIGALVDGVAYISSDSQSAGTIYALNARDGTERWHFQGQGAVGAWEVVDGQVYIVGDQYVGSAGLPSDILYDVDASTGTLRWSFPKAPSGNILPLGIEHGLVYLLSNLGSSDPEGPFTTLYALNPGDGSVRWQITVDEGAVLGSSVIYVPAVTGAVLGYRASDGALLWRTGQLPGISQYARGISGIEVQGTAYLSAEAGVFALDASSGKLLWSGGPGGIADGFGGFAGSVLITSTFLSVGPGPHNAIYGLNPRTGAALWTYTPAQELVRITIS